MQANSGKGSSKKNSFPVRLRLHYSWILAFILIIALVATQFPEAYSFWRRLLIGALTACIFLLMIIIKQVALNFIARNRNVAFRRVIIYVFGGVPGITREYSSPLLEILLGTAGLVFSLAVASLFYLLYIGLIIVGNEMWGGIISWLSFIFLLLSIFHFIPGYPLDGGRILRGLMWRATGDYDRAMRISVWIGGGVVFACIAGGILMLFLQQAWLLGITLIFVGLVLYSALANRNRLISIRRTLQNTKVKDVMSGEYPHITPQMSVARIIQDYCLVTGQYYFLVVSDDKLLGSVGLRNIRSVPRRKRGNTTIASIMVPAEHSIAASTNQSAADAIEQMVEMDFEEIPVIEDGKVIGTVFRDKLMHLAKIKSELRI